MAESFRFVAYTVPPRRPTEPYDVHIKRVIIPDENAPARTDRSYFVGSVSGKLRAEGAVAFLGTMLSPRVPGVTHAQRIWEAYDAVYASNPKTDKDL